MSPSKKRNKEKYEAEQKAAAERAAAIQAEEAAYDLAHPGEAERLAAKMEKDRAAKNKEWAKIHAERRDKNLCSKCGIGKRLEDGHCFSCQAKHHVYTSVYDMYGPK